MKKNSVLGDITPSICEAVYEEYSRVNDSLAEVVHKNNIQVRDFIVLSFVCDQGELSIKQVAHILGIGEAETCACASRLVDAKLIEYRENVDKSDTSAQIRITPIGRNVTLRVHGCDD
jgi:hypothetical protein